MGRAACLVVLLWATQAAAAPTAWRVDGIAGTRFPLDLGAQVLVEGPGRLRLGTSFGYLPETYVSATNRVLVALDVYSRAVGELIETALQNSLVWTTQLGWRPFPRHGFALGVGYTLISLGGGLTGAEAISAASRRPLPAIATGLPVKVQARSTLHALSAELSWEWLVAEHFLVRAALGGFGTLDASTTLTQKSHPALASFIAPFLREGEAYLDDTYTSYVHAGYVALGAGVRF